jgi:ABC-type multidrug transport system ATPase subunit/ABC-type multidrug transport system permease subunit
MLNILAGRSASAPGIDIRSFVTINNKKINPVKFRNNVAYVMQDDGLLQTATPREAIRFSARMRLDDKYMNEIEAMVDQILDALGLRECADTIIGGPLIKGISGGQRKRTSVGIELITKPSILLLDEPTSGLDSYTAYSLIQVLKKISASNATVLVTIHQPSSETFFLFDRVIFMKDGRIVYQGNVDGLSPSLSLKGYVCPADYNPADYMMFIMKTLDNSELEGKSMFMNAPNELVGQVGSPHNPRDDACTVELHVKSSFAKQLYYLSHREFVSTGRNIPALVGRFGVGIALSLIYGIIFQHASGRYDGEEINFQSHFGSVTMIGIFSMFGSAQPTLLEFPNERPMFMREYATGTYGTLPYFLCKTFIELPLTFVQMILMYLITYWLVEFQGNFIYLVLTSWGIGLAASASATLLGCLISDPKQAVELSGLVFVPQLLFSGFFIRTSLIPVWLRWAQYICSLKYGLNLLLLIEFSPYKENCNGDAHEYCKGVLSNNDIDPDKWYVYLILLVGIYVILRAIAAFILARSSVRFY